MIHLVFCLLAAGRKKKCLTQHATDQEIEAPIQYKDGFSLLLIESEEGESTRGENRGCRAVTLLHFLRSVLNRITFFLTRTNILMCKFVLSNCFNLLYVCCE